MTPEEGEMMDESRKDTAHRSAEGEEEREERDGVQWKEGWLGCPRAGAEQWQRVTAPQTKLLVETGVAAGWRRWWEGGRLRPRPARRQRGSGRPAAQPSLPLLHRPPPWSDRGRRRPQVRCQHGGWDAKEEERLKPSEVRAAAAVTEKWMRWAPLSKLRLRQWKRSTCSPSSSPSAASSSSPPPTAGVSTHSVPALRSQLRMR